MHRYDVHEPEKSLRPTTGVPIYAVNYATVSITSSCRARTCKLRYNKFNVPFFRRDRYYFLIKQYRGAAVLARPNDVERLVNEVVVLQQQFSLQFLLYLL